MKVEWLINSVNRFLGSSDGDEFVSLDLGSRYIKCAVVESKAIKSIFVEENSEGVKTAVGLLKKNQLLSKKIKLSLKGPDTIIRYIPFPKVEKNKLKEVFSYELSKYIPFPSQAVYFDLSILDENYSNQEFLILLAAVKKDTVDPVLREFEEAKLNIAELTLNSVALINLFFLLEKEAINTAIIDIGFSSSLLNLIKKGVPYLSREIKIGSKNLIERLASVLNKNSRDAEKLFIASNLTPQEIKSTEDVLVELSEEIRSSFDYFEMNVGEQVQKIYITGGISGIGEIGKIMKSSLGSEIETLNLKNESLFGQVSSSLPGEMLAVVLGLSL